MRNRLNILLPSMVQHNALTLWVSNTWAMIIIVALQYFSASTVGGLFDQVYQEIRERAQDRGGAAEK